MKVTVDIDCTPQEARAFLGLPDVAPVQEAFVEALHQRMTESIAAMDGDAMIKAWMPDGMAGWDQWGDMLRGGAGGTGGKAKK
ncbi:MAG: hypothetical protein IIB67_09415 [Proteobacteria bacterium]|nr:hypothetical protein [Pseudomonadota bacterium]